MTNCAAATSIPLALYGTRRKSENYSFRLENLFLREYNNGRKGSQEVRNLKKYIVEFGMGTDFHGQDVTKAAKKAAKDAISRSCLCGLEQVLGLTDFKNQVFIRATVAVTRPDEVDCAAVAEIFPVGTVEVIAVQGGLRCDGLCIPAFGDCDESIEAAVAAVEVYVRD
ncbi:MAG TPA: Lin0512 family protein [Candidatus Scatomorpha stercoravium]|nr:Lin0512 family protein [Candidatus Scatomorpha stercoravium]